MKDRVWVCANWKALSFLAAAADDLLGRRWKEEEEEEVLCLEAVKNWVAGDLAEVREKGGRLGVVKLEMSLRSDEESG